MRRREEREKRREGMVKEREVCKEEIKKEK